jgi:hypothetical protein
MKQAIGHHEFGSAHHDVETSSDRSFGLVFAGAFTVVAAYLAWKGSTWWPLPLAAAPVFLILALARPALLAPLNRAWSKFGLLLGAIVAPIVMGVIYFGLITPMALLARLLGKDFLRLKRNPEAASYWLPRQDRAPSPERLRDQF